MYRNYRLYLEDILAASNKIITYVGDISYENLLQDEMRIDAIIRNFEIVGEAASKVPSDIVEKYPFISWRKIIDFRNILTHEYFGIDYEIMWEIIKDKCPALQSGIMNILEAEHK
ncbi:HepT-like ribonuclease domain-containing protein [Candidatus Magnetomonas plexicatena]|uniref:HepT-like ribonuclease domain-containing protein n=1 Tax=Candidatus Magnetomonas plexicatena TaxID=2552947 RepID=UPI001C7784C2|nr:DUF86 domain-containing protein [Nitrospirales bacterium LBB_01]